MARGNISLSTGTKFSVLAAAAFCIMLLSGCATVRSARQAQSGTAIPAGERTLTAAEIGLDTNTVLSLAAALKIAATWHPQIVQATQSLASADAQLTMALAGYMPSLDASAGYSRSTANSSGLPQSNDSAGSYKGALQFNMLIYDFGKTPAVVQQALGRRLAAMHSLQSTRNNIAFNVRNAFFELCKARELLKVNEESVLQYSAHLDQVKAFEEVGRRIRYDVTKAEVDLGNARLNLINAANDLTAAKAGLDQTLGLAEAPEYKIETTSNSTHLAATLGELIATARQKHPDLLALKTQEAIASSLVDQTIAELYPSIGINGQYSLSGATFPLIWNWLGSVQAALNIFSGGERIARIDEAVAGLRSARARTAEREQQLHLELTSAASLMNSTLKKMELSELIVKQAAESLTLISERYRVGKASSVEVTDAQVTLTGAKADRVKARFDHEKAIARIRLATGEE